MSQFQSLDDLMREEEARREAEANTPEAKAAWERTLQRAAESVAAEHAKGVRLGWFDEDGNPLGEEPDDEDEDEDEDA